MKAIVLAAGKSSRFWPLAQAGHKSTYRVGYGRPVIDYTLEDLGRIGIKEVKVVRAMSDPYMTACLRAHTSSHKNAVMNISALDQAGATGMGDAVLAAENFLSDLGEYEQFLVLNASQININEIVKKLNNLNKPWPCHIMFGQKTDHPENFGVMRVREDGRVLEVKEKPNVFLSQIRIVGVYILTKSFLKELKKHSGETSLEDALQSFVKDHGIIQAVILPSEMPLFSLKYPWDLLGVNRYLLGQNSPFNEVHPSVRIGGGAQIDGYRVVIQKDVRIYENAVIKGPCFIDEGAMIGDHTTVRDHCYIGKNVVVGAHCEVKNSILYNNVQLHHNFVGDSILDEDCSLGAGTITANKRLDRKNVKSLVVKEGELVKHDSGLRGLGVIMGSNVKTGINVSLMPGVKIGSGSTIYPGVVVKKSVPDGSFCESS